MANKDACFIFEIYTVVWILCSCGCDIM